MMNDYQADWDEFWGNLAADLGEQRYRYHPPDKILRAYVDGQLEDDNLLLRTDIKLSNFLENKPKEWSLTTVSLHVASCPRCAVRVAALRGLGTVPKPSEGASTEQRRNLPGKRSPRERIVAWELEKQAARCLPWAWAAAGLVAVVVNFLLSLPSHANYFVAGGKIM